MRINCFVENIDNRNDIVLDKKNSHHLKTVLRAKIGQKIIVFNGKGDVFESIIKSIKNNEVVVESIRHQKIPKPPFTIDLYQSLPKINRWELVLQKSVELGVTNIFPLNTKFTETKIDKKKYRRFDHIISSAAEQSEARWMPFLHETLTLENALKNIKNYDCSLMGSLFSNTQTFKHVNWNKINKISLFIGPEGDFCKDEEELMVSSGIMPITFGTQILRTETAAIFGLSIIVYELSCRL